MKEPIILEGEPFDWEEGQRQAEKHGGGNTIRGAMFSDPGIMACPGCDEHLWKEGIRVRCPHCGHEWKVASPGPLTARALRSKIAKAEAAQPRTPEGKRHNVEELRGLRAQIGAADGEAAPPTLSQAFSQALYTEPDVAVPPWRKCDLVFTAERFCLVEAVAPWQGFRLEPLTLPVLLRAGESIRLRLANHTGIDSMGGVVVSGVHLP
jgi:hypothetical protein